MIKIINKVREVAEAKLIKKAEEEPTPEEPKGPTTEELLSEILAELKNKVLCKFGAAFGLLVYATFVRKLIWSNHFGVSILWQVICNSVVFI